MNSDTRLGINETVRIGETCVCCFAFPHFSVRVGPSLIKTQTLKTLDSVESKWALNVIHG